MAYITAPKVRGREWEDNYFYMQFGTVYHDVNYTVSNDSEQVFLAGEESLVLTTLDSDSEQYFDTNNEPIVEYTTSQDASQTYVADVDLDVNYSLSTSFSINIATTWDGGSTTWDDNATAWDVTITS